MRGNISRELGDLSLSAKPVLLHRLRALGVSWGTISEMGSRHYFGGSARVLEVSENLYVHSGQGAPHLIIPVFEDKRLVDLVAFTSAQPMAWLLRLGVGWSLGLLDGLEPHCWRDEATLWASPLDWLRAGRAGLCVLDWSAPEVLELARLPNIRCQNKSLAGKLKEALVRPRRLPLISWQQELRDAA